MDKGRVSKEALDLAIDAKLGPIVAAALAKALGRKEQEDDDNAGRSQSRELSLSRTPGSLIAARKFTLKDEQKGIAAARFVRALAASRGDMQRAKHFMQKVYNDDLGTEIQRAMMASDLVAGGALIPPEYASEIIELLRARTVVRAAGARVLPMDSGSLTIRKSVSGTTASYVGESQDIPTTGVETGVINMVSKKLAAIVPISNDLLKFTSSPAADEYVRDDLVLEISIREDRAFLRDDGTQHTPRGLRSWALPGNVTTSNGTTATDIEDDFKDLLNDLESADVRLIRPAWFMHPTRKNHLRNLRDANGNLIYPEIRGANATLYGWPIFTTTSLPANLGSGSDSEIMLVDMVDAIIAEASNLEIVVDGSASYVEAGTMKSAFSRDETLIRAITRHDFAMRHAESVAVKTGVAWGG
jgi:HK97 family phage major capsid protein